MLVLSLVLVNYFYPPHSFTFTRNHPLLRLLALLNETKKKCNSCLGLTSPLSPMMPTSLWRQLEAREAHTSHWPWRTLALARPSGPSFF